VCAGGAADAARWRRAASPEASRLRAPAGWCWFDGVFAPKLSEVAFDLEKGLSIRTFARGCWKTANTHCMS